MSTHSKAFRRAVVLNPNLSEAYSTLGHVLADQGDLPGALDHYDRALALQPHAAPHGKSGSKPWQPGDLPSALASCRDAHPQPASSPYYNDDYVVVDPDYVEVRPRTNAKVVAETFQSSRDSIAILDFGGGNGLLARTLLQQGFNATTYDPFSAFAELPRGKFNLITCFEVMEHTPFPDRTVSEMSHFLADEGIILCSTLTQPATFEQFRLHWWYASPRNGHISLYSKPSLSLLFQKSGLQLHSLSDLVHVAYRKLPAFAAHLARGGLS